MRLRAASRHLGLGWHIIMILAWVWVRHGPTFRRVGRARQAAMTGDQVVTLLIRPEVGALVLSPGRRLAVRAASTSSRPMGLSPRKISADIAGRGAKLSHVTVGKIIARRPAA